LTGPVRELVEAAGWLLGTTRLSLDGSCDVCCAEAHEEHRTDEACGQVAAALAALEGDLR
jgi:hypothetical protein